MSGFFGKLIKMLGSQSQTNDSAVDPSDPRALRIYIKCSKCGEGITLRIRKGDELQRNLEDTGGYSFYVQKIAMGNKCYNRIPVRVEFDEKYRVINHEISGGVLINKDEYESLTDNGV